MTAPRPPLVSSRATLARGVTATGWYTIGSVLSFVLAVLFVWLVTTLAVADPSARPLTWVLLGAGGILTAVAFTMLMLRYRRDEALAHEADAGGRFARFPVAWLLVVLVAAAILGLTAGSVLLPAGIVATSIFVMRWSEGLRLRLVVIVVVVLALLAWREIPGIGGPDGEIAVLTAMFTVALPPSTALAVWWWDIVLELDRARGTEARLSAAQERLRLANDVHDLQGHHLQVIALQLELADRLLPGDPAAAAEQVRLARGSVDDARRGTRELATQFRGVPLADELANAADLLRAAGLDVRLDVTAESEAAPSDLLGPIVRECTTNILKHGGGRRAVLSLARSERGWTLRIANDLRPDSRAHGALDGDGPAGSGLAGIAERIGAAGGTSHAGANGDDFEVIVSVPYRKEAA